LNTNTSETLHAWLDRVCSTESPPDSVVAYNIGLFETDKEEYSAYLIGSDRFDGTDEDWACYETFAPSEKYCVLPDTKGLDWSAVEAAVIEAAGTFVNSERGRTTFLASARTLTVGFDSGNLQLVR